MKLYVPTVTLVSDFHPFQSIHRRLVGVLQSLLVIHAMEDPGFPRGDCQP